MMEPQKQSATGSPILVPQLSKPAGRPPALDDPEAGVSERVPNREFVSGRLGWTLIGGRDRGWLQCGTARRLAWQDLRG